MKKRLVWIGALLSLGLFAAVTWAYTHPAFAIVQLQDYVTRKTGRTLVVNGGAEVEFFPRLGVRLDDVFLSNPAGMAGNFARASSIRLPLQFSDLIGRKLKIRHIALVRPVFNFLIDAEGKNSWVAEGNDPVTGAENAAGDDRVKEPLTLRIDGGSANFVDARHGQTLSLQDATAAVTIGGDTALDVQGTALLKGRLTRIEAHVKSLRRVGRDGSPFNLSFTAPALRMDFTGNLSTTPSLSLAGMIDTASPDLRELADWLGSGIKGTAGLKNFSLAGGLESKGAAFKMAKANIALDGMVANGDLSLDLTKNVPDVIASLSTDLFTLDPYLGEQNAGSADPGPDENGWNTTPLGLGGLKGLQGSLTLSANLVRWKGAEFGPVDASTTLKDGRLHSTLRETSFYGGKASAEITVEGSQENPSVQLTLDARAIKGEKLFEKFAGVKWLAGNTDLNVSLSVTGDNQREMMSGLNGTFKISVTDGEITGLNVVDKVSRVGRALSDGWGEGPENLSSFDTAAASFAIDDGIAKSSDVNIESAGFKIAGEGEIDMLRRGLNFKFDPTLPTGGGRMTALPVQVAVKGPWDRPKIYPYLAGAPDDPDAAHDALRGLGLSDRSLKKIGKSGKELLDGLFGN